MSETKSPLQKYAELLGRSIKIIECEVDPEAAACILRHNNFVDQILNNPEHQEEAASVTVPQSSVTTDGPSDKVVSDDDSDSSSQDGEEYVLHKIDKDESTVQVNEALHDDVAGISTDVDTGEASANAPNTDEVVNFVLEDETGVPAEFIDAEINDAVENEIAIEMTEEVQTEHQEIGEIESAMEAVVEEFESVSQKIPIEEYSQEEWKGVTYTAECMRMGYTKIVSETHCRYLRKIRGDNYCGLRATIFQCLTQNVAIFEKLSTPLEELVNIPSKLIKEHNCDWLVDWSFATRIPSSPETRLDILKDCLSYLAEQVQISRSLNDNKSRNIHFTAIFNSGTKKEIYLFEALKLMMLYEAVKLFKKYSAKMEVPVFAWLMFARDTSEFPQNLMLNHFNSVGNSGGLEQVEMCLLGFTLNITISVFRPSKSDQEDFTSYYPDDHIGSWENCYLVAEDDRHYNIITD